MTRLSLPAVPDIPHSLRAPDEWDIAVFKVLANNDTGAAPGHQGGILVPKDLVAYFPELEGTVTENSPTVETRIDAELFDADRYLATVSTRYQFQTWGATRSEERRLTGQLKPLLDTAQGGDILVIRRHRDQPDRYRLTLVRKGSSAFREVGRLVDRRRWGVLTSRGPVPVRRGR